jgi:hypothetical protein
LTGGEENAERQGSVDSVTVEDDGSFTVEVAVEKRWRGVP